MVHPRRVTGMVVVGIVVFVSSTVSTAAAPVDGTLVRAANDSRVYLVQGGEKRWIESADAFWAQGFSWSALEPIDAQALAAFREGAAITANSIFVLPGEEAFLSDLSPFPAYDVRLDESHGRSILRFTSTYWNQGKGYVELIADPQSLATSGDVPTNVFQRIRRLTGNLRDRFVGNFLWHAPHNHFHYNDFVEYRFESVGTNASVPITRKKDTRCLRDWILVDTALSGVPQNPVFSTCTRDRQGISVGWADVYEYTLSDQYLDVEGLPPGRYRLWFDVNPGRNLAESRTDNNVSFALLDMDVHVGRLEMIAWGGPFKNSPMFFPDGMRVRAEGDTKLYVIHNNKKRWIRSEVVSQSYGYSGKAVEVLPKSIIDAIPLNNLVRVAGTATVYALNDAGYARPILNPEIFHSYGFGWRDVADINATEFTQYPEGKLMRKFGDERVYAIEGSTKRWVKTLEAFNANAFRWEALHVINAVDADAYSTGPDIE